MPQLAAKGHTRGRGDWDSGLVSSSRKTWEEMDCSLDPYAGSSSVGITITPCDVGSHTHAVCLFSGLLMLTPLLASLFLKD